MQVKKLSRRDGILTVRRTGLPRVKVVVSSCRLLVVCYCYPVVSSGQAEIRKRNLCLTDFKNAPQPKVICERKFKNSSRSWREPEVAPVTLSVYSVYMPGRLPW